MFKLLNRIHVVSAMLECGVTTYIYWRQVKRNFWQSSCSEKNKLKVKK